MKWNLSIGLLCVILLSFLSAKDLSIPNFLEGKKISYTAFSQNLPLKNSGNLYTATTRLNDLDSDGDGVPDPIDLDDDNDGILDSAECDSANKIKSGIFPNSGSALIDWITSGSFALNGRGLQFDADNAVTTIKQNISGIFSGSTIHLNNLRWLTTDNTSNTGSTITEIIYNGIVYATINTGVGVQGSVPVVSGNNGATINIIALPTVSATGIYSDPSNLVISLPESIPVNGELQIKFTSGSSNADDISIEAIQLFSCSDKDGDGIPNVLDLDSDGDGCADAIEGTAGFSVAALTTASGELAAQSLNKNFGTTVNTNGVPTTVGSTGQAIGQSQDFFKNACLDTDGDSVPDFIDLDDDNDGILDCVENNLNTNVGSVFKPNNNALMITSPATGPANQYRLTNGLSQNGQVWSYGKVDFSKSFQLPMKILLSGADGIAAVFHNSPLGLSASGTYGQGLGARGIENGIALEFDTFPNSCTNDTNNGANCDPDYDHGSIRTTAGWINAGKLAGDTQLGDGTVDDGQWHEVVIYWDSTNKNLSYTFDGAPVTNYTFDETGVNSIESILGGSSLAYFGYTASTGDLGNVNSVGFDNLCSLPLILDTDGDGLPNHLDLDSDGDGCPDAIEGTGAFTATELISASGDLAAQNTNKNFGTAVDANGVPAIVGPTGQNIGNSQNEMMNECISFTCLPDPYASQQTWWLPNDNNKVRIDFQSGTAVLNNPPMGFLGQGVNDGYEGNTSVTHPITGELLFVTDGNRIYKGSTGEMANGLVGGHDSAGEAAGVIPDPNGINGRDFIVFGNTTFNVSGGLNMAKYNLETNTVTDITNLLADNSINEALEVIPHTNGDDYWILVNTSDQFVKSYLYSKTSGFNSTPVSFTSVPDLAGVSIQYNATHSFISWDPRTPGKLLIARHNKVGLSNFDPSTGELGVWEIKVTNNLTGDPNLDRRTGYSAALSPNGKYIYYNNSNNLMFYNMTTGISSQASNINQVHGLKVAKDGRLYFTSLGNTNLYYLPDANNPVANSTTAGIYAITTPSLQLPNNVYWGCIPCESGTVAPILTNPAITTIPTTVGDLIGLLSASNKPDGTVFTIHSSATATASNQLPTLTAITSGTTYYVSYFDGLALCYSPTTAVSIGQDFCYKPGIIDGNNYPTNFGITSLGRAGADTDNWPMVRQSAWAVLESKTKGLVINRVKFNSQNIPVSADGTTPVITAPVEGMLVYDTTNNCLKVYTSTDGGVNYAWHCMVNPACPE